VVVRGVDARVAHGHARRGLLDARARGQEDAHAAAPLLHALQEAVVEEAHGRAVLDHDLGGALRVERVDLEHVGRVEVARVEPRVDGGGEPDEAAADALAEREAQLELGRRLVDLVDHERVVRQDVAVLEPAAGDAGGHHDHVLRRAARAWPRARG
jgi:hypothetical protein